MMTITRRSRRLNRTYRDSLLAAFVLAACAGCAAIVPYTQAEPAQVYAYAAPAPGTGTIIVQRYKAGHRGMGTDVYIDGVKVALVYGGEKATLHVPAGPHSLTIGAAGWPLETVVLQGQCVVYAFPGDPMISRSDC
jgi:hypothetical protein